MRSRFSAIVVLVIGAALLTSLGWAAPPPPAPPTPLPRVPDQSILRIPIPFYFSSLWVADYTKAQPVQAVAQGNKAVWPLVYDLRPHLVHLTWVPLDFPHAKIPDLLAGKGYTLELVVNAYVLLRGPDGTSGEYYAYAVGPGTTPSVCPPGKTCLGTTIRATTWYSTLARPWHVELRVKEAKRVRQVPQVPMYGPCPGDPNKLCPRTPPGGGGPEPMTVKATVEQSGPEVSYFAAAIYPTFQHSNCRTCHYVGTPTGLLNQHGPYKYQVGVVTPVSTPRGTLLTCGGGCHYPLMSDWKINQILQYVPGKQFDDREWKAPGADMGINWTGKSAVEICKIITTKLPTAQALKHHFHDDVRIAWAVHSGKLPSSPLSYKPLAPPGSYQEWQRITTAWADNGFPCPK